MPPHTPDTVDAAVAATAARQHGLFTLEQARAAGATWSLVQNRLARGMWTRVHRGVYAIAGVPVTWHGLVLAAVLAAGPPSAAARRTAAALLELEGFPPRDVEIVVPERRHLRPIPGVTILRSRTLRRSDITVVDGIPCTRVTATLRALAACTPPGPLANAMDDAVRRKLVRIKPLRRHVAQHRGPGRAGLPLLAELIEERVPDRHPRGGRYNRMLAELLEQAGITGFVPEFEVRVDGYVYHIDLAHPGARVGLEVDTYTWHDRAESFEKDRQRHNRLVLAGWQMLLFTSIRIDNDPSGVVDSVRRALGPYALPMRPSRRLGA